MGTMLQTVKTGKIFRPLLIMVYGPDGVGKSSFGARAPKPIFVGPEQGTDHLDVARCSPKTFAETKAVIKELITDEHDYETLVIDSLDWIEPEIIQPILERDNVKSINLAAKGYGNGVEELLGIWKDFITALNILRDKRKMNIILIAHSDIVDFTDPQAQMTYQRYQLKLHKKTNPIFREYVDAVLFANYETFAKKDEGKVKAFSSGSRVIHTERRPGFDAKNRFGLPFTLPLSIEWNEFVEACRKGVPESIEVILSRITGLIGLVKDEATRLKVQETVKKSENDANALLRILNRLEVITEDGAAPKEKETT